MADPAAPQQKVIPRETPEPDEARRKLVSSWQSRVKAAEAYWADDFKRMRKDMEFAKLGADGEWKRSKNYVANILQRHIDQRVASLYAKNPKAFIKRRNRLDFEIWDGNVQTLQAAQSLLTINPADPNAIALLQDVTQGLQRRTMLDKIGRSLELLFNYFVEESQPTFKRQAKQGVRRALVTGIAYCELDFQRLLEKRLEITTQIEDASARLSRIEAMTADVADGITQQEDAEAEQLRLMIRDLQQQDKIVVREGLVFDWAKSMDIILDPATVQIDGWVGTRWLSRRFRLTPKQIKETFKVDVTKGSHQSQDGADFSGATEPVNTQDGNTANAGRQAGGAQGELPCHKIWDKDTGQVFWIAEGWSDFLKEPAAPDVQVEQFFPVFPLQFHPVEDDQENERDTRVYGLSEIELLRDMQSEYNRSRQGLREHRVANLPGYAAPKGLLDDADRAMLQMHPPNALVELNALLPGQKVEDVLQALPKIPIDPAVYEVSSVFDDVQRTSGGQEANFGGTSKSTATEVSVAEGSKQTASSSNVDDLDDFLTAIARGSGQILLLNMSREQVSKIVGVGAVWPEFTAQEVAEEVFLEVRAGSSGRPNKQIEIANFERIAPFLLQIPGIPPQWIAEQAVRRLDDNIDLEEAFLSGLPSIVALNAAQNAADAANAGAAPQSGAAGRGAAAGQPNDPNAQGAQGAQNAPNPQEAAPGPQPAFPTGPAGPGG